MNKIICLFYWGELNRMNSVRVVLPVTLPPYRVIPKELGDSIESKNECSISHISMHPSAVMTTCRCKHTIYFSAIWIFFNIIYTPTDNSQTKHFHRKNSKLYYFLNCNSISSFISLFNSNRKCAETKTNWNEKRVLCHKLIPFPLKFCGCHRIWIGKNKESTQLQALEALQTKGVAVADAKMEIFSIRCDQLFWRE